MNAILLVAVQVLVRDAEADVIEHVHGVEQRTVLEDVADTAAQRRQLLAPERRHELPVDPDLARIRLDESDDVFEQHALTNSGGPKQRNRLAFGHEEIHAVEHDVFHEALRDLLELDAHFAVPRMSFVRMVSSIRIVTDDATTACVVARPTPSAPCCVLNPM